MSKRYGRVLAAMVRGLTAPQHPWRRANTRLRAANALFQTHRVATRHGPIVFISTGPGSVLNSFESDEDCFGKPLAISFRQSMIGFSSDEFRGLFALAPPNYIKLDVDGIEEEILDGAVEILGDPALRSVLVELEDTDTPRNARIIQRLESAGFTLSQWGHAHRGSANGIFTRPKG